jgi:hypothetical protein
VRTGSITTDIIKNPNLVLKRAIEGLDIRETITFEVSTGPTDATLNGGGTANISFLAGTQFPITTSAPDGATGVQRPETDDAGDAATQAVDAEGLAGADACLRHHVAAETAFGAEEDSGAGDSDPVFAGG